MKKILSIDFDIIMAPCIEIYNNMVPSLDWRELEKIPQLKVLTADLIHYNRLTKYLIKLSNYIDKENIFFIENHAQIINYLKDDDQIDLINIDHHHDIGYFHKDNENDKLNCGNWVGYLLDNNILSSYTWICNENSIDYKENKIIPYDKRYLFKLDLDTIPIPDKLIICLSEPWVPPNFRELFFVWIEIYNKIYNTAFKIDFKIP